MNLHKNLTRELHQSIIIVKGPMGKYLSIPNFIHSLVLRFPPNPSGTKNLLSGYSLVVRIQIVGARERNNSFPFIYVSRLQNDPWTQFEIGDKVISCMKVVS